jgi:hypothetical protein
VVSGKLPPTLSILSPTSSYLFRATTPTGWVVAAPTVWPRCQWAGGVAPRGKRASPIVREKWAAPLGRSGTSNVVV